MTHLFKNMNDENKSNVVFIICCYCSYTFESVPDEYSSICECPNCKSYLCL